MHNQNPFYGKTVDEFKTLIEQGTDVNAKYGIGITPLRALCETNVPERKEKIELLISAGADATLPSIITSEYRYHISKQKEKRKKHPISKCRINRSEIISMFIKEYVRKKKIPELITIAQRRTGLYKLVKREFLNELVPTTGHVKFKVKNKGADIVRHHFEHYHKNNESMFHDMVKENIDIKRKRFKHLRHLSIIDARIKSLKKQIQRLEQKKLEYIKQNKNDTAISTLQYLSIKNPDDMVNKICHYVNT